MPAFVALPRTTREVHGVLVACRDLKVPVVARGAGTGLSGGALPFSRLRAAEPLADGQDPGAGSGGAHGPCAAGRAQPRHLRGGRALRPFYAPDPSSQAACSLGGNVAENAGGVHCLKYGLTVNNLAALQILTLDGEVMVLGGDALDAPGFDLMALMTGSEGLLAVVTEATVRLLPKPACAKALLAAFDDVRHAGEAVARLIGAGVVPAGLEMMDQLAIVAAEKYCRAGYPIDAKAILLCELDGEDADVDEALEGAAAIFRAAGAREVRTSARRSRAAEILGRAQGGVPGHGPAGPRLLLHGRNDPAGPAGRRAGRDRAAVGQAPVAGGQRLPCRRRQSPPP